MAMHRLQCEKIDAFHSVAGWRNMRILRRDPRWTALLLFAGVPKYALATNLALNARRGSQINL
jgi:hypothetical protein